MEDNEGWHLGCVALIVNENIQKAVELRRNTIIFWNSAPDHSCRLFLNQKGKENQWFWSES